jgi:hypothetical protein
MPVTRHLLLVDDGSTDGTLDLLADLGRREDVTCLHADRNRGKGSALRRGFAAALEMGCDLAIVQDADLEYDPADHGKALAPLIDGRADAVIGSRFLGETHRVLYFWHSVVNRGITALSNMLSNLNLTDIECGTKAFTRPSPPAAASETDRRPLRDRARDRREAREAPAPRRPGGRRRRGSSRSRSATRGGPTPRARRSAGATASRRSAASCSTTCSRERLFPGTPSGDATAARSALSFTRTRARTVVWA